jgi:hypothetical protein
VTAGDGFTPCSLEEAVARMLELEASRLGCYSWGAGGYHPANPKQLGMTLGEDTALGLGWDCAGAVVHALRLTRHRPGFNRQMHASITDDLNVDSLLEDADPDRGGRGELGQLVTTPAPGILLLTPTIKIPEKHFDEPGHVRLILDASGWNPAAPRWADVIYLECRGPNGRRPGVVRDHGASVDKHDADWPHDFTRADGTLVRPRAALVRIRYQP